MVSGYVKSGRWKDALEIFCNMVSEGIDVDKFSMTSIICSCADFGMLEVGRQIHSLVLKCGHKLDAVLCSSLVDMYSKCGSLSDAYLMFNQLDDQDVFLWTSIICACALHGRGREAVQLFESKRIDLLGRAGRLNDIKNFIEENKISHLSSVWSAFLSSCGYHKNAELGKQVGAKLLELEPLDQQPCVLVSDLSIAVNNWEESAGLRHLMQKQGNRYCREPAMKHARSQTEGREWLPKEYFHPRKLSSN
ncbi:putative pentatricopeptide repeat-containing protein [Drosera capensis]